MKEALILGGVCLACFWAISVVLFFVFLVKDFLEDMNENNH